MNAKIDAIYCINLLTVITLANKGLTVIDIAIQLQVSDLTVRRYLMKLRKKGLKIHSTKNGVELYAGIDLKSIDSAITLIERFCK